MNWLIKLGILVLITGSYLSNRQGAYGAEKAFVVALVICMAITVFYGVLKLKQMQTTYDAQCPPKPAK